MPVHRPAHRPDRPGRGARRRRRAEGPDIDRDNLKHPFATVAGIGDRCQEEDDNIFFEKSGVWVQINLVLLNDPGQNKLPLQTAARAIVARMG